MKLSNWQLAGYMLASVMINALGNALTISLNLGSALWTASAVNLSAVVPIDLGTMMLLLGGLVMGINALLLHRVDWRRMVGNLVFMVPFSYLVALMTALVNQLPLGQLPLVVRLALDLIGISFIGIGISIYQRVNVVLHPNDDLMQILRFDYLRGNAPLAQVVAYIPPIMIITAVWFISGSIKAVNVGTVFGLVAQGAIVAWADRHVFSQLKHRHLPLKKETIHA